jgi:hypothetical protein
MMVTIIWKMRQCHKTPTRKLNIITIQMSPLHLVTKKKRPRSKEKR